MIVFLHKWYFQQHLKSSLSANDICLLSFCLLINAILIFLHYIHVYTLYVRKYEIFIWSIDQDISRVSDANECGILVNMRHEFHISKHPRIIMVII